MTAHRAPFFHLIGRSMRVSSRPRHVQQQLRVRPHALAQVLERDALVVAVDALELLLLDDEGAEAVAVEPRAAEHPVVGEGDQDHRRHHRARRAPPQRVGHRLVELGVGRREVRDLRVTGELHLDVRVGHRAPHPLGDLLRVVAREHPAIDLRGRFRRMTLLFALPRNIVTAKVVLTIAAYCRFA